MSINLKQEVEHKGVAFEVGREVIIVPSLTTGQIEDNVAKLIAHDNIAVEKISPVDVVQKMSIRRELILEALKRNYKEITMDEARDFITMQNAEAMFKAALGQDRISLRVRQASGPEKTPAVE